MTKTPIFAACICLAYLAVSAFGQDPLKVAPNAYKLQFENESVKVTRVHYGPHEKIPVHSHTEYGTAYVYLNDCGPVVFKHINEKYADVTRPETKTGSFRLFRTVKEVHEVENPNDTPSDFLRVEFKTIEDKKKPLQGKFHSEDYSAVRDSVKIQFENDQIRATRFSCAQICTLPVNSGEDAIVVLITPARLKSGKTAEPGSTFWIENGSAEQFAKNGSERVELIRFDLKSKPLSKK